MNELKGSVIVEYILILSMIAILSISNLDNLEDKISLLINNISTEVSQVASTVSIP
jgi:hypothetical protein